MAIDSSKIYKQVKNGGAKYNEELHCKMIIDVMNELGTLSAFCMKAGVSDRGFYKWIHQHPEFHECYRIAGMIARENWEEEGRLGADDEHFNMELWRVQGSARYGVGKTNRVRVHIDAESTPYDQYKQLVSQASMGDFTAAEFKQLVEAINVGIRAYESFELQKEVDAMKNDLLKMSHANVHNIAPIAKTA